MTPQEITDHIADVQREYIDRLAQTDDPIEQRNALVVYFGRHAMRTARSHWNGILADPGRKPHLGGDDFMAHAEVAFKEFLAVVRKFCDDRDVRDTAFRVLCAEMARSSFFGELDRLMHTVSARGST